MLWCFCWALSWEMVVILSDVELWASESDEEVCPGSAGSVSHQHNRCRNCPRVAEGNLLSRCSGWQYGVHQWWCGNDHPLIMFSSKGFRVHRVSGFHVSGLQQMFQRFIRVFAAFWGSSVFQLFPAVLGIFFPQGSIVSRSQGSRGCWVIVICCHWQRSPSDMKWWNFFFELGLLDRARYLKLPTFPHLFEVYLGFTVSHTNSVP